MLVRVGRMDEAMRQLATAADSDNATPRFALAYALAIDAQGDTDAAIAYLNQARERFPNDQALLASLLLLYERTGDMEAVAELRGLVDSLAPRPAGQEGAP